jgi:signal recognition particle subunit SRP54
MFQSLSNRLQKVFENINKQSRLTDADVDMALKDIRTAMLESDVHFKVVRDFLKRVKEKAVGVEISDALNPGQQVVKIVHDELLETLGTAEPLNLGGQPPKVIMLVGLQGSGKTTMAGKLANRLRKMGHRPLLVAADPYRPAAADQLQTLAESVGVQIFRGPQKPAQLCADAVQHARSMGLDIVILDTAGRLQIDDAMMAEVAAVKERAQPKEILLVADAMLGQEAVQVATGFNEKLGLTGLILTKIDGDARGGAAISMRAVTGVPIKFLGTSEKLDGIEVFTPERLVNRILGMGDVIGLIERAQEAYDEEEAKKMQDKLRKAEFDLNDFLESFKQIRKMGPVSQLLDMIPGMSQISGQVDGKDVEKQFKRIEAIIQSMTPFERRNPREMNASRKRRVAAGSGTQVQDVNRLLKQYRDMQDLMKQMKNSRGGRGGGLGNLLGRFGGR